MLCGVTSTTASETRTERPLRRDAERNRQKILEGAARVFAESGLDVGMDELARRVGVGTGTLYRRFPTKDALIEALFTDHIERVVGLARAAQAAEDPIAGIRMFLCSMLEMVSANRGLKELLMEARHGDPRAQMARDEMQPCVGTIIGRAVEAGALRAGVGPADLFLAMTMLGAVVERTRDVNPDAWRRYVEIVIDGLRADPSGAPLAEPGLTADELARMAAEGPPLNRCR